MKRCTSKQDGQTIIWVVIVTTILFVITSALGAISWKSCINITREEKYLQAYYTAEAGIEKTLAVIKTGADWLENLPNTDEDVFNPIFPETEVSNGITNTVAVSKKEQCIGNSLLINSLGKCINSEGVLLAQKALQYKVDVYNAADYFKGLEILPAQPVPFNLDVILKLAGGNLVLNGSINLSEFIQVNGDILASGEIGEYSDNNNITGQIYKNYAYIPPFPDLDVGYYLKKAEDNGQDFYTDVIWSLGEPGETSQGANHYSDFYYIDGDVTISGDYIGNAVIFATGVINVVGNLMPVNVWGEGPDVSAGGLTLISLEDIVINDYEVYANIVAKGFLVVQHGAKLHGAACVGVNLLNGAAEDGDFEFEVCDITSMEPLEGALEVQIKKVLWKELYPVF